MHHRRFLCTSSLLACLLLAPGFLSAQEGGAEKDKPTREEKKRKKKKKSGKETIAPEMAAILELTAPGKEHEALEPLVGNWDALTRSWMDPSAPPSESKAMLRRKWILDGRHLQEVYRGKFMGMSFRGQGTIGYDKVKKQYVGVWVDNLGTGLMTQTGEVDDAGKVFTFRGVSSNPMTGKEEKHKTVLKIESPDRHTLEMFMLTPDGNEVKTMEIVCTRKPEARTTSKKKREGKKQ